MTREFVIDNIDYDLLLTDYSRCTRFPYDTVVATGMWKDLVVGLYHSEYTEVDPDENTACDYCEIMLSNGMILTCDPANVRKATGMECLKYEFEAFL